MSETPRKKLKVAKVHGKHKQGILAGPMYTPESHPCSGDTSYVVAKNWKLERPMYLSISRRCIGHTHKLHAHWLVPKKLCYTAYMTVDKMYEVTKLWNYDFSEQSHLFPCGCMNIYNEMKKYESLDLESGEGGSNIVFDH